MTKKKFVQSGEKKEKQQKPDEISEELLVIAQEVKIVKSLACNDLRRRNKQMRKLRKWLQIRAQSSFPFTEEDFMRIWKGLYYNMWYSDKPLVQEDLAEQLGQLIGCFDDNVELSVKFFGAFLNIMEIEWFGIDQWRIDKFLMLIRRMLRHMLKVLKNHYWSSETVERFNQCVEESVLSENVTARGLTMHYLDIFFEELAKVSNGDISAEQVNSFIKPFIHFMATQQDFHLISYCRSRIFYHLLYQSSLGREYSEKYDAWKEMGFPTSRIDDLEKVEATETYDMDVENDKTEAEVCKQYLDPRAGNIDVFIPELHLDGAYVIAELETFLSEHDLSTKRRKILKRLLAVFQTYQKGIFPLGVKSVPLLQKKLNKSLIKEKVAQLEDLENELYGVDRKLKQLNKRKRRKLLKSINFENVDENNYEETIEGALPMDYLSNRKNRSRKAMVSGWLEEPLNPEDFIEKKMKKNTKKFTKVIEMKKKKLKIKHNINKENLFNADDQNSLELNARKLESHVNKIDKKCKQLESEKQAVVNPKDKIEVNHENDGAERDKKETPANKQVSVGGTNANSSPPSSSKLRAFPIIESETPTMGKKIETSILDPKTKLAGVCSNLVVNPLAKKLSNSYSTPVNQRKRSASISNTPKTRSNVKRVRIDLNHNTSQKPHEYIQQIKKSPNVPYDATKKPSKGLLKPNSTPSPINPFYKKKIGLSLFNDTI
uniref:Ribosomal RNA processing protein 1 homolog n=1 Tax=Glossina austeni TaxID=7395 RepID=A0A1A9VLY3_GLOAU